MTTDWPAFFISTIKAIHDRFAIVVDAAGCREAWLQAELFYAAHKAGLDLKVNHHCLGDRKKADLSCGDPPTMIAEIKLIGHYDSLKMRDLLNADVERMRLAHADAERYMILIIRKSADRTTLGDCLNECSFSGKYAEHDWPDFRVRVWRL